MNSFNRKIKLEKKRPNKGFRGGIDKATKRSVFGKRMFRNFHNVYMAYKKECAGEAMVRFLKAITESPGSVRRIFTDEWMRETARKRRIERLKRIAELIIWGLAGAGVFATVCRVIEVLGGIGGY